MDNEKILDDILDPQWQDAFQQIKIKQQNPYIGGFFQYRDNQIINQITQEKQTKKHNTSSNSKKQESSIQIEKQVFTLNSSSETNGRTSNKQRSQTNPSKISKDPKNEKQQIYSKVYRQKMKQKYKNLQEQNAYLKKRINQLENQIRQQQLQLNRLKFSPPQKQFTIDELSKQYINASNRWFQQFKTNPPQYFQQLYLNDTQFHLQLVDFWTERGFAGKKKLKILNYYLNQILQSILKDSEKYLCLLYANSKSYDKLSPLPGFQAINNAHMEVYKNEGDLWHRLKQFNVFLHPMSLELNKNISQFYKKYEDILSCTNKIHEFLRKTYQTNMCVAKKRLEMQRWFDFYKYGKLVRKLRYQWFDWMKSLAQKDEEQEKQGKKCKKKKKSIQ